MRRGKNYDGKDDFSGMSAKARQQMEYFESVSGYNPALSGGLRKMPSVQRGAIRDHSIYTGLVGRTPERPICHAHMSDEHVCYADRPDKCRDILCFTVPQRLLSPDAASFCDYNIQDAAACSHSHALAFFFHTLHCLAVADRCSIRVYIEAVVRNPGSLPLVVKSRHATHTKQQVAEMRETDELQAARTLATARNNCMGYRIWAVLEGNCYGAEVAFLRAIFRAQATVRMCTPEAVAWKLRYLMIPGKWDRIEQIKTDAQTEADDGPGKRHRSAEERDEAIVEAALEEDAEDDAEREDAKKKRAVKFLAKVERAIKQPTQLVSRLDVLQRGRTVGESYVAINSRETFIKHFINPQYWAAGLELPKVAKSALMSDLAGDWGEALRLDQLDAPLGSQLSVRACLSFRRSMLILTAGERDRTSHPCSMQMFPDNYGIDQGVLNFPLPALVWRIGNERLAPQLLMQHAFPWHTQRFAEQLSHYQSLVTTQKMNAISHLQTSNAPMIVDIRVPVIGNTLNAQPSALVDDTSVDMDEVRQEEMMNSIPMDDLIRDDFKAPVPQTFEERTAAMQTIMDSFTDADPLQLQMAETDTHTSTERIIGALTQLREEFVKQWLLTLDTMAELIPPPTIPKACWGGWRHEKLVALNSLRTEDFMRKLMQTLGSAENVSEQHRNSYRILTREATLKPFFHPVLVVEPNMTTAANCLILFVEQTATVMKMQGGYITMLKTFFVQAPQTAMVGLTDASHGCTYGAAGTTKSLVDEAARKQLVLGTDVSMDHETPQALRTRNFDGHVLKSADEARPSVTDQRAESIAKDPQRHAEFKQQLTTYKIQFDRYVVDPDTGIARNHRVEAERIFLYNMQTNEPKFGGFAAHKPDNAMVNRLDYLLHAPMLGASDNGRPIDVVADLRATDLQRVFQNLCTRRKEEHAMTVMVVAMVTTGVISNFSQECVDVALRCAFDELDKWAPPLVERMRQAARSKKLGSTILFSTARHALFSSESSPYLQYVKTPDDTYTPIPVKCALSDLPLMIAPEMYTRVDHGLWAVANHLGIQYQFLHYLILMEIASRETHFRRSWMKKVYQRHNIPLIDTAFEERWKERGCSTKALPTFLQYVLDEEALLDLQLASQHGPTVPPKFGVLNIMRTARITDESERVEVPPLTRHLAQQYTRRQPDEVVGSSMTDPNWLDTGLTPTSLASRAVLYIKNRMMIDTPQVFASLDAMAAELCFRVPSLTPVNPATLSGELRPSDIGVYKDNSVINGAQIRYTTTRVMEMRVSRSGERTLHISTAALMLPQPMLLCMALTAFENKFTRRRNTVLLMETPQHAHALVPWEVRARPGRTLSVASVNAPGIATRQNMARTATFGDSIATQITNIAVSGETAREYTRDIEDEAFERHMRDLKQMPPMRICLDILEQSKYPDAEKIAANVRSEHLAAYPNDPEFNAPRSDHVEQVFLAWLSIHPSRPNASEQDRRFLYESVPELAPQTFVSYPKTNIVSEEVTRKFVSLAHNATPLYLSKTGYLIHCDRVEHQITMFNDRIEEATARLRTDPNSQEAEEKLAELRTKQDELIAKFRYMKVLPPTVNLDDNQQDFDDNATLAKINGVQRAFMLMLCSEPWFSEHTRRLHDTCEWGPTIAAALEIITGSAKLPAEAYVLSDERDEETCVDMYLDDVPGFIDAKTLSLASLNWLERSLQMDRLCNNVISVYTRGAQTSLVKCLPEVGKAYMRYENMSAFLHQTKVAATSDPPNQEAIVLLRRYETAHALTKRIQVHFFAAQKIYWNEASKIYTRLAELETDTPQGQAPSLIYRDMMQAGASLMERHRSSAVNSSRTIIATRH